ncbi:MAG TPA: periplasmic heavy metal sensor [Vicinamibacterales bacterium]|jgi:protein CpxP
MIRVRSLTAAVAVFALAAGVVYAQGPRGGGPGGPGGRGMRGLFGGLPLRELQLTDAQQQQVKDIRSRHQADIRDAMSRLEAARQAQQKAVEAVPADEARITALTQDMVQAQVDVAIQASRVNSEIWSVLTPDQQSKLKDLRAQRQAQAEQRRQQFQQRRNQ